MKTEAAQYFYTSAGGRGGPVGFAELRLLAVAGRITRRDKVLSEGMAEWLPAETISNLFRDLPPDLLTDPVQPLGIPIRSGVESRVGILAPELLRRVSLRRIARIVVAALLAGIALELVTDMFGVRWRIVFWAQRHSILGFLLSLIIAGLVFTARKQLALFWRFLVSENSVAATTKNQPPTRRRWFNQLSGRTAVLLMILICVTAGLVWHSVQKVRAREQWERERPQREAEFREMKLRHAGNDGFSAGAKLAEQSATTGVYRVARTEAEIRSLAQGVLDGKITGIVFYFRVNNDATPTDQWAAWKDGFVEGYVDYMARLKKRFAPAY